MKNHFEPPPTHTFPIEVTRGISRAFRYAWLKKYSWLVYSPSLLGGFCKACALFVLPEQRQLYGNLVNRPFIKWRKLSEQVGGHEKYQYHQDAIKKSKLFLHKIEHPEQNIDARLDSKKTKRLKDNRKVLRYIADGVLFCGKQGIALRGDHEIANGCCSDGNPGNLLAYLQGASKYVPLLKKHLNKPKSSRSTYVSGTSQNE